MNQATIEYINIHANDDVRQLALKGSPNTDVDMVLALEQIAGRRTARKKLPLWAAVDGIEYPPHLSMEQCSGEQSAGYKARLAERLMGDRAGRLIDLTGGFGVDFSFMARGFAEAVYVERQERLCEIARHNMPLLGLERAEIVCGDAAEYLQAMPVVMNAQPNNADNAQISPISSAFTVIFLDPARRDSAGARTYAISDCTPDVMELKEALLDRADYVIVKLSPMLDWRKAVSDLGDCVGEVHIVSVDNECKDLLLVMSHRYHGLEMVYCVDDNNVFEVKSPEFEYKTSALITPDSAHYLFEPNASIMKAGCFGVLAERYAVAQLERNSHLFVADRLVEDFPGRRFVIDRVTTMNKKDLKAALTGITKANIAVRNFPLSAVELRKRLKLADGGDTYIFGTTAREENRMLFICRKV